MTRVATKFELTVSQRVYLFNAFLLPKLDLALHYVAGKGTKQWLKKCDRMLVGCIKHAVAMPVRPSHSAVALTTHLRLPSWMEVAVKVSELFLRVNSSDARWGALGRTLLRDVCATRFSPDTLPRAHSGGSTWMSRAAHLAVYSLQWTMHTAPEVRPDTRGTRQHLFAQPTLPAAPTVSAGECSFSSSLHLPASSGPPATPATTTVVAHDIWSGWGTALAPSTVHVYTDGSFDAASNTSAWSVVVADAWLHRHYASIPADEHSLLPAHVAGAAVFGARIATTAGIYPAELQPVARTLAMLPLPSSVHIHSDSQATIATLRPLLADPTDPLRTEREQLRRPGRPLVRMIAHLLQRKRAAGGAVTLQHVKAHSRDTDIHSVGNRIADFHANRVRVKPDLATPSALRALPLDACERHMRVEDEKARMIIDDLRRAALVAAKQRALAHWGKLPELQRYFAHSATLHAGALVLKFGSAEQQRTLVHVATNCLHQYWATLPDGTTKVFPLHCAHCNRPRTLAHLLDCAEPKVDTERDRHRRAVLALLDCADTARWFDRGGRRHLPLKELLLQLFPIPLSGDPPPETHRTSILCGFHTRADQSSAVRMLGFTDKDQGHQAFLQLRLLALSWLHHLYSQWKEVAALAAATSDLDTTASPSSSSGSST